MGTQLPGDAERGFARVKGNGDVRPAIFSVLFSVLLTTTLIVLNTGQQSITETALAAVDSAEAELVARDVASSFGARQGVSPSLATPEVTEPQSGDSADLDSASAVDTSGQDTAGQDADETEGSGDELSTAGTPADGVPTTTSPGAADQPTAATTTQPSRSLPAVQALSGPPQTPRGDITSTTVTPTSTSTTTTTRPPTTTTAQPVAVSGVYSVAQVIDGTIGNGDGANPNEDGPNGRHDASLFLPQGWSWAQGTTRNDQWGNLQSNQFVEFRCAVIPENGHTPSVDFRINFQNGAYFQYAGGSWSQAFEVDFDDRSHGAYLGVPGQVNTDPFASGRGAINWRQEADGSFSAPWNPDALMMHFWASERQSPTAGQIAEFMTSEMRLMQPDGQTVDLSEVRVLFQCGLDYYNTTGGQGTKVPGPGIGKYHLLTPQWQPGLWVTLPGDAPAASTGDFRAWLSENLPPNVAG